MLTTEVRHLRNRDIKINVIVQKSHTAHHEAIIDPNADLSKFPKLEYKYELKDSEITIGDMHGNALKFIYFLVKQRILTMPKKDYQELIRIYNIPVDSLSEKDLTQFTTLINNARVNKGAKIRLLGDELSDRGSNDYFTLKLLQKITKEIPVEIIQSNHGLEFLYFYETKMQDHNFSLAKQYKQSLSNLSILIKKKLVHKTEIAAIIEQYYLPNLKIVSYTLDEKQNDLTLYSHALTEPEEIKALADAFKVKYDLENITNTLDEINKTFSTIVANKKLITTSKLKEAYSRKIDITDAPLDYPIVRATWSREYKSKIDPIRRKLGQYNLFSVHGHDGAGEVPSRYQARIKNLDNEFGKKPGVDKGQYQVLYAQTKHAAPKESDDNPIDERPKKRQRVL